jgi:excisionase family DNA binding protein
MTTSDITSLVSDRLVVKPREACRMLSCGNTRLYELLNASELESYRDGGSRKITVASIHAYVRRRLAEEGGNAKTA